LLSLPPSVRLFMATQPVDGRKGADSLMVLVRDVLRHDPLSGHLFIFSPSGASACASSIGIATALRHGRNGSKKDAIPLRSPPTAGWALMHRGGRAGSDHRRNRLVRRTP
jgi:hypothetical protein